MKYYALALDLADDPAAVQQYIDYHANPFPEVVAALKEVGILDMKIFRIGQRLFMYYTAADAFDPSVDFPRYLTLHPRCQEWEDLMTTLQKPLPEATPGQKWVPMEQVFQL